MTLRLFLLNPDSAWTGRVNQASFTYPLGEVVYDGGSAIITPQTEMTVLIGTSAGADDLGRTRLRDASGVSASGTLKIGRSSQGTRDGEVALQDDAYITILNDFRVWAKIPYYEDDGTIYKDHDLAVGTKTQNIPPVANSGVGFAATIDGGDIITASWDASTASFANSGSISTYLWDVDDGAITVGNSGTAAITATFPAGFRWVSLKITDSNAETHTMRMPVYARDPASDTTISVFNIQRHPIKPDGQEIAIRIREAIAKSNYPDGTLVMVWENEPASASDRSHMLFIGWHQADPASIAAKRSGILTDTVINCVDVAGRLKLLPGFIQSVALAASPTEWTHMLAPNMDKYLHYLLHWHSNALDLADWTNSGTGTDFPFMILGSDGANLWEQVADRAHALVPDYVLVCNTLGQMATIIDPLQQDTGDRTGTSQVTLSEDDYSEINYVHQRAPHYHWLRGDAILASASAISAVFCIAPGGAPGQGGVEYTSGNQLAKSQSDLNACEGHRYARLNAPQGVFRLTLAQGNDIDLEPANLTWLTLNMNSDVAAQRGLTLSSERFLIHEIDVNYQHAPTGLTRTVKLRLERETSGYPAQTYEIPEGDIPDPEWDPPPQPDYDDDPGETTGDGFGTAYIFLTNKLVKTSSIGATSPTWTDITSTITGTSYDFILDPWNPTSRGFALTSNGVWRVDDLDGSPSYTQVLSASDVATATGYTHDFFNYKIQASINLEDYIVVLTTSGTGLDARLWCFYSEDAGDNWSHSKIDESIAIATTALKSYGGLDVVPHTINNDLVLYAGAHRNNNAFDTIRIYKSIDRGANWSQSKSVSISGGANPTCLNTPYFGNEDGNEVWLSTQSATGANRIVWKSTDGFSTYDVIDLPGVAYDASLVKRLGIEIYVPNNNRVAVWSATNQFFKSVDGSNFTEVAFSGYVKTAHGDVFGAGGFPTASGQYYIVTSNRHVFVSTNGGSSWSERTGNLQSIITSNMASLNGNRNGIIVPVWVAE